MIIHDRVCLSTAGSAGARVHFDAYIHFAIALMSTHPTFQAMPHVRPACGAQLAVYSANWNMHVQVHHGTYEFFFKFVEVRCHGCSHTVQKPRLATRYLANAR